MRTTCPLDDCTMTSIHRHGTDAVYVPRLKEATVERVERNPYVTGPTLDRHPCSRTYAHLQHIEILEGPEFLCDGIKPITYERNPRQCSHERVMPHPKGRTRDVCPDCGMRFQRIPGTENAWLTSAPNSLICRMFHLEVQERQCGLPWGHPGDHHYLWTDEETAEKMAQIQPSGEIIRLPEPTKQRVGDQRLPQGGQVCVQDLVIAEMEESKRVGTERYGSPLMTFNGRRSIQDAAEEARDFHVYLTQIKAESEASRETLIEVVTPLVDALQNGFPGPLADERAAEIVDAIMGWVAGQMMGGPR